MKSVVKAGRVISFIMFCLMLITGCKRNVSDSFKKVLVVSDGVVQPQGKAYFTFFDTVSYVYSYAGDSQEEFDANCENVAGILEYYHKLLDIYHEYSGVNNLCTVNRLAGKEPVKVDIALIEFLDYAKDVCVLTDGEMDITMGSVLSIWHDARTSDVPYLPDEQELEEAAAYIGFDFLEVDRENLTVSLKNENSSLDVGALGKGYAAEKAAEYLSDNNLNGYVLNIGGNIKIVGNKPDDSGWKTGIRDPKDPDNLLAVTVELSDTSCVTSGSYERFFTVDGVMYSHIIDKDTLYPADYYKSVSVITRDSGLADALSTALFCMPYDKGRSLVESLDGVDCIWIFEDGSIKYTTGVMIVE